MSVFQSGFARRLFAAEHLYVVFAQLYEACWITQSFRYVAGGLNRFPNEVNPAKIIDFLFLVIRTYVHVTANPATLMMHLALVETFTVVILAWLATHSRR